MGAASACCGRKGQTPWQRYFYDIFLTVNFSAMLTTGFISKWYPVLGLLQHGWWPVAVRALLTSLLVLIYIMP